MASDSGCESSDCVHGCECSPACYAAVTEWLAGMWACLAVIVAWEEPGGGHHVEPCPEPRLPTLNSVQDQTYPEEA